MRFNNVDLDSIFYIENGQIKEESLDEFISKSPGAFAEPYGFKFFWIVGQDAPNESEEWTVLVTGFPGHQNYLYRTFETKQEAVDDAETLYIRDINNLSDKIGVCVYLRRDLAEKALNKN